MTRAFRPPALDPDQLPERRGSSYPGAFKGPCAERRKKVLGDPLGLTGFGVNLVCLPPGAWSAQRHWHTHEDEFVYVLDGTLTLVTDDGEQVLSTGMAAGFPAGRADGHHLVNRGDADATYLEIGTRVAADDVHYPDIDLLRPSAPKRFTNKQGEPY